LAVLVTDYLGEMAERFPDKIAYSDVESSLTYKELRESASKIATALLKKGITHKPVLVCLDRSVGELAAFLGVALSGSFYTPIDMSMPVARIDKIVNTLEPAAAITSDKHLELMGQTSYDGPVLTLEDCGNCHPDYELVNRAVSSTVDTDPLYVLFTSGSTGTPKGVVIAHRSIVDYAERVRETFDIDENAVFGNQAPFYFDHSGLDIYVTLCTGARMHIIPKRLFSFPVKLLEHIVENQINTLFWVPSAYCLVANLKALGKVDISCVTKVLSGGEVMPTKQLNKWRKALPNALFANLYGPTEIAVDCTYYIVDRDFDDSEPLPIGVPFRNTDILVLDEHDNLVTPDDVGVEGELCVRGSCISMGYYNNPEKTSEVFVQNPLIKAYPDRIYRTGDLVRYNERGEIMYVSRMDFQIQHAGRRVELGEIECAAQSLPEVTACCCQYDEKRMQIVLFYSGNIEEADVSAGVSKLVPDYMVPGRLVHMDALPLNLNGKVDRQKLKSMI
jgi:D-alanine--poly(phosphoribitol) ligase subunit 1